eukprot:scaffold104919_cov27-Phaeocystis_antarctica.AAC.1
MSSLLALDREFAPCQAEGIRSGCGASCGFRGGRRRATAAHAACRGGLNCNLGAGHGEERTPNMLRMSVTLEVSKLSGWLNADAACRESKGGHVRCRTTCGLGGGRRRATAGHAACREVSTADWGQATGRSAR